MIAQRRTYSFKGSLSRNPWIGERSNQLKSDKECVKQQHKKKQQQIPRSASHAHNFENNVYVLTLILFFF